MQSAPVLFLGIYRAREAGKRVLTNRRGGNLAKDAGIAAFLNIQVGSDTSMQKLHIVGLLVKITAGDFDEQLVNWVGIDKAPETNLISAKDAVGYVDCCIVPLNGKHCLFCLSLPNHHTACGSTNQNHNVVQYVHN